MYTVQHRSGEQSPKLLLRVPLPPQRLLVSFGKEKQWEAACAILHLDTNASITSPVLSWHYPTRGTLTAISLSSHSIAKLLQ